MSEILISNHDKALWELLAEAGKIMDKAKSTNDLPLECAFPCDPCHVEMGEMCDPCMVRIKIIGNINFSNINDLSLNKRKR